MMDDLDKTIPPQRAGANMPDMEKTMPGHHDRKTDGRFAVGDLIMGRYKVLAELGQGGMGVVYKCFDETAGIEVALKALPPELSHNSLEMDDIKENFQLVHNLHHPNIASSNNLERNPENGNYYLIMECCEGEDLRRWIRKKHKERSMTWEEFLGIIKQVADALDYAHGEKVMHRDIKPGNIMINSDGNVKVLDFGLAAQIHTSMTRVSMAYHGTSGTGPYMAPEQWRGRPQGAASDQYALAVMAYEMLAGSPPFESADPAVLKQAVLDETPDGIKGLPDFAQVALNRALSKEPTDRFNSCADFAAALGGEPVAAPQRVEADTPDPANANDPEQEDPLLTRASLFLESGDFRSAKEYCERVLDRDPKNGEAYFIRLLAELKLKKQDDLLNASRLDRNQTFLLALKFAGPERKQELETLLQKWKDKAREKARARAKILKRIGVITGICVLICLLAGGFFACEYRQKKKKSTPYVKENYSEAEKNLLEAAKKGNADAQFKLGVCYAKGDGVAQDQTKAVEWWHKAAAQGHAEAQYGLGLCYVDGIGVEKDQTKAVEWLRKAAAQGHADAQFNLGMWYANGWGVEKDQTKAVEWWHKAAAQGHADAQFCLGLCYAFGDGVVQDQTKAVEWWHNAAELGDARAQDALGMCYAIGRGVEKDQTKAVEWLRKAAAQGYADAQFKLGMCYACGDGVAKDLPKAVEWWHKAAAQGHAETQYNLGLCYYNGHGVAQDLPKAVEWWHKAAAQGHADAQCGLGLCYVEGFGVEKDQTKAVEWLRKAAAQGHAAAKENLERLGY